MRARTRRWPLTLLPCLLTGVACGDGGGGANGVGASGGASGTDEAGAGGDWAAAGAAGSGAPGASGSGGSTLGSGGTASESCAASTREARLLPANLLFLLDASGSMNCNPPNGRAELSECQGVTQLPDEDTKWEVTSAALTQALSQLATLEHVSVGLTVFPMIGGNPEDVRLPEDGPDVPIRALDPTQLTELSSAVSAVTPRGETPLANATLSTYELLRQKLVAGELEGNTFVVLLTDGSETANQQLLQELLDGWVDTAASGFGIRTFAIGAPGSEPARATLSKIALDGQTPGSPDCDSTWQLGGGFDPEAGDCHLDMTTSTDFADDLTQALIDISQDNALACDFEVPQNPNGGGVNLNEVNVTFSVTGGPTEEVLYDGVGTCGIDAEGWQFSQNRQRILLCGDICEQVKANTDGRVDIVLGCPTQVRIR